MDSRRFVNRAALAVVCGIVLSTVVILDQNVHIVHVVVSAIPIAILAILCVNPEQADRGISWTAPLVSSLWAAGALSEESAVAMVAFAVSFGVFGWIMAGCIDRLSE